MQDTALSNRVRVVIAGGPELVRRGIREVLGRDRRLHVVADIERPDDLVNASTQLAPQLVLAVVAEPDQPGGGELLGALAEAATLTPGMRAIVLTAAESPRDVPRLARSGAAAVLLVDAPAAVLLRAVDEVLAGQASLDARLVRGLFDEWRRSANGIDPDPEVAATLAVLSAREREVLHALTQGRRNKEIAAELGVSVGTVKTHLRHIFRKLTVGDRTGAVLVALQRRLPDAA